MIHLYLSIPLAHPENHQVVDEIIAVDAGVGLVQAAAADDELTRDVARAHIAACEGVVAIISGTPADSQIWEISTATTLGVPVLIFSEEATIETVEGMPVEDFTPAILLDFVNALSDGQ